MFVTAKQKKTKVVCIVELQYGDYRAVLTFFGFNFGHLVDWSQT